MTAINPITRVAPSSLPPRPFEKGLNVGILLTSGFATLLGTGLLISLIASTALPPLILILLPTSAALILTISTILSIAKQSLKPLSIRIQENDLQGAIEVLQTELTHLQQQDLAPNSTLSLQTEIQRKRDEITSHETKMVNDREELATLRRIHQSQETLSREKQAGIENERLDKLHSQGPDMETPQSRLLCLKAENETFQGQICQFRDQAHALQWLKLQTSSLQTKLHAFQQEVLFKQLERDSQRAFTDHGTSAYFFSFEALPFPCKRHFTYCESTQVLYGYATSLAEVGARATDHLQQKCHDGELIAVFKGSQTTTEAENPLVALVKKYVADHFAEELQDAEGNVAIALKRLVDRAYLILPRDLTMTHGVTCALSYINYPYRNVTTLTLGDCEAFRVHYRNTSEGWKVAPLSPIHTWDKDPHRHPRPFGAPAYSRSIGLQGWNTKNAEGNLQGILQESDITLSALKEGDIIVLTTQPAQVTPEKMIEQAGHLPSAYFAKSLLQASKHAGSHEISEVVPCTVVASQMYYSSPVHRSNPSPTALAESPFLATVVTTTTAS